MGLREDPALPCPARPDDTSGAAECAVGVSGDTLGGDISDMRSLPGDDGVRVLSPFIASPERRRGLHRMDEVPRPGGV